MNLNITLESPHAEYKETADVPLDLFVFQLPLLQYMLPYMRHYFMSKTRMNILFISSISAKNGVICTICHLLGV